MSELKLCPFCGGEAEVSFLDAGVIAEGQPELFNVDCLQCGVGNPEPFSSEYDLWKWWNTRADNERIKQLEAENEKLMNDSEMLIQLNMDYKLLREENKQLREDNLDLMTQVNQLQGEYVIKSDAEIGADAIEAAVKALGVLSTEWIDENDLIQYAQQLRSKE